MLWFCGTPLSAWFTNDVTACDTETGVSKNEFQYVADCEGRRTARPGVETPFVTPYTMVLFAASSAVSSRAI